MRIFLVGQSVGRSETQTLVDPHGVPTWPTRPCFSVLSVDKDERSNVAFFCTGIVLPMFSFIELFWLMTICKRSAVYTKTCQNLFNHEILTPDFSVNF